MSALLTFEETARLARIPDGNERVTRWRADLARAALGKDLALTASVDQSIVSNVRQPAIELNAPKCVTEYSACPTPIAPGRGCETSPRETVSDPSAVLVALVLLGLRSRSRTAS